MRSISGATTVSEVPGVADLVGRVSHTYRESGAYGEFINRCRVAAWSYAIDQHRIATERVVDVGCSYGSWAENFRRLGFGHLVGIEPNEVVLKSAAAVYDEVHHGFSHEMHAHVRNERLVAANGVLVHILREDDTVAFLTDLRLALAPDGFACFSVIHVPFYSSCGRRASVGSNSCTRELERYEAYATEAGLELVDRVGTFIEPWALPELEFLAQEAELRLQPACYAPFEALADLLRPLGTTPFSELLLIARPAR